MINYTTPTISRTLDGVDLTDKKVYVTIAQNNAKLTKSDTDISVSVEEGNSTVEFTLTQEESAMFAHSHPAQLQINWIDAEGVRDASSITAIKVFQNLLNEVISYNDEI